MRNHRYVVLDIAKEHLGEIASVRHLFLEGHSIHAHRLEARRQVTVDHGVLWKKVAVVPLEHPQWRIGQQDDVEVPEDHYLQQVGRYACAAKTCVLPGKG